MPKLTGGQAITESLKAHDVNTVFGIISIHNLDLFDALLTRCLTSRTTCASSAADWNWVSGSWPTGTPAPPGSQAF